MLDYTHLNLHDQFITLIDMNLHAQNQVYTPISFWDLKALIISLSMSGHAWHHSFKITSLICSFGRYVPASKNSILYLWQLLRYSSLKILLSDWLRPFSHLIQEPDFSQTCGFNRIIKVIMVHDWNPENLHIKGILFFCAKSKKPYFWGVLGHYPQNKIFS